MKVLLISATYPTFLCGVGAYAKAFAGALSKTGVSVEVLTSASATEDLDYDSGVIVHREVTRWSVFNWGQLSDIINRVAPDIVHIQYPTYLNKKGATIVLFPVFIRLFCNKPVVVTLHEFSESSLLGRVRNVLLLLTANYIAFTNLVDQKRLSLLLNVFRIPHTYVPLGSAFETESMDNVKTIRDSYLGVFLGRMDKSKGEEDVIRALQNLKEGRIRIAFLTESDLNNPYHVGLRKLAEELGVSGKVIWFDQINNESIIEYLNRVRFAVIPYRFGVKEKHSTFKDVLVHGIPFITTRSQWTPSFLIHKKNVYFVDQHNIGELSRAIDEVVVDKELSDTLSNGLLLLAENFSWRTIVEKFNQIYVGLIVR